MSVSAENLRRFVKDSGIPHWESANSYVFTCPICRKADKLWMYKSSGWFSCWVCKESGFRGKPEFAFAELLGLRVGEIRESLYGPQAMGGGGLTIELADHFGDRESEEEVFWAEKTYQGFDWPPFYVDRTHHLFAKGRKYLYGRGIDEQTIEKYDIRYSTAQNRVVFPYVLDGQLVGWQARVCGSNVVKDADTGDDVQIPKTLTTLQDGVQTSRVMFANNLTTVDHCVLTEGPIDALKCELAGGNVAALGKGVSEAQIDWISNRVSKLYLALDIDAGAEMTRIKKQALSRGMQVYLMVPPPHREDFGDCTLQEAYQAFKNATLQKAGQLILTVGSRLVI